MRILYKGSMGTAGQWEPSLNCVISYNRIRAIKQPCYNEVEVYILLSQHVGIIYFILVKTRQVRYFCFLSVYLIGCTGWTEMFGHCACVLDFVQDIHYPGLVIMFGQWTKMRIPFVRLYHESHLKN